MMEFSHGFSDPTAMEMLSESWPMISAYGVLLGIGIVGLVRRRMVPAFSLSRRARKE